MSRMDECMDTLTKQLFKVMYKEGWSIRVAADFMCINRNMLSDILKRKAKNVSLGTISQIADSLDMPVVSLICPEEAQNREIELTLRQMHTDLDKLAKKVRGAA